MSSFEPGFIESQPISQSLLRTVRTIGEYKGKQELFKEQAPQVLETLRQAAVIQSTESSNRIEGVTAPLDRIKELVAQKTTPRNRSEQEIAGYRDVLNTIHSRYASLPLTSDTVLQLHRDLYRFTEESSGQWKRRDNEIAEIRPDGTRFVRFRPTPAHRTAEAMDRLHQRFDAAWQAGEIEPLLLIPAYALDFLCIHPFRDGNGRMARLLTLLLLYQAGYEVGRFISLETAIEDTKEGYYDALQASSQNWHEGQHSLIPWWEYFVGVMLVKAYREFEDRVGATGAKRGAKRDMIRDVVTRLPNEFRYADLERALPAVSRPTIARALRELSAEGVVRCVGRGRDATWEKLSAETPERRD